MDNITLLWAGLALAGFVIGLFVRTGTVLRVALGLFMLSGLGLVLANTAGWSTAAYWFGIGMAGIAITFAVAIVGALAGRLVRKMVGVDDERRPERSYNSILPD
jgi:hypothetical protein